MKIGQRLKYKDEDEIQDWAGWKMASITDLHVIALDLAGWKIVNKDENTPEGREYEAQGFVISKWPFDSKRTGYSCPDWCEDIRPTATVIPLINGKGKPDQSA